MFTFPSGRQLVRRLPRCLVGLACFGFGIALIIRGEFGASPWDVFHTGVSQLTGLSVGTALIVTSGAVLLLWIPLRQRMGVGTVLNALEIGLVVDPALRLLHETDSLIPRIAYFVAGTLIIAIGSGLYIGSGLGPGPRDGLMTGLNHHFGWPIRRSRTLIEVAALSIGAMLGGRVGAGTVIFALTIGPLAQITLKHLSLPPVGEPGADPMTVASG
jgi:uncharacterized membrane protein YczE